ncbi:MAG: dethiobiotin synthase [Azoarcus sp.]|jgi:dethiobiotin synthetase|nr:dethiobiotin synthase [Azoarcus sp.]
MNEFRAWFVTGTDTEVGKTLAACVLIHAARAQGYFTLGMKPVAAGAAKCNGKLINEDAARLRAAGSFDPGIELINPYCLRPPVAPHIAAREENIHIEPARIKQAFTRLRQRCERLIVEGAGGFLVPLDEHIDCAVVARELGLPIILVVGMRLGCINHALLTAEAIANRNLRLAGWVANSIQPDMPYHDSNIATLCRRIDAPLLGALPYAPGADPAGLAQFITLPA